MSPPARPHLTPPQVNRCARWLGWPGPVLPPPPPAAAPPAPSFCRQCAEGLHRAPTTWPLLPLVSSAFCFRSKLEKQKEKKRKEEQKRKIACLSFTSDGDAEENEEEDADGE